MRSYRLCCLALVFAMGMILTMVSDAESVPALVVTPPRSTPTTALNSVGEKVNFVQTSQQVRVMPLASGAYKLVMSGVDHRVLWFEDVTNGNAGLWSLSHFIERWQTASQHLETDKPNATLVANTKQDQSGQDVIKVFRVRYPQYNVQNDTLTYDATLLFSANHEESAPHLYQASLFIDIICRFGGECF